MQNPPRPDPPPETFRQPHLRTTSAGLVVPCHPQQLAFGETGVHKQVHDLVDGVLIVRAEPEQKVHLQLLIKIILKLFQNCAFDSTRIAVWAILYLRFAPVRVNATSQLVPFQPEAVQGFSVFPFCLTSFFEKWV